MQTITIRFFAGHRDIVGTTEIHLEIAPATTVGAVWDELVARYPRLAGYHGRLLYAVNQEFSTPETPLQAGDELAFIPPVSGGVADRVR